LPEPPVNETQPLDRQRLFWARCALALAALALLVDLALGVGQERSLGVIIAIMTAYGVLLALGILWWTVRNLRQGEPRPTLDQPGALITNFIVFVLWISVTFTAVAGPNSSPPVQWSLWNVLSLLLFVGFLVACAMWIRATSRRWHLSYAFKRSASASVGS
jgi:uncharacterized membrane protein